MANDNTSTIQSYIDSATGTVQQALGNLTGSTGDENKGIAKQNKADVEHDLSHATAKGPGFTATTSGVARDDPDRQKGAWNQTVGAGKEFVGNVVGSEVSPDSFSQTTHSRHPRRRTGVDAWSGRKTQTLDGTFLAKDYAPPNPPPPTHVSSLKDWMNGPGADNSHHSN
jgi:uncharacterized protein YjbJ (UPF0337 family)